MFAKGAAPGKVKTWSYDEDEEDFTKGDKSFHAAAPQLIMILRRCHRLGYLGTGPIKNSPPECDYGQSFDGRAPWRPSGVLSSSPWFGHYWALISSSFQGSSLLNFRRVSTS